MFNTAQCCHHKSTDIIKSKPDYKIQEKGKWYEIHRWHDKCCMIDEITYCNRTYSVISITVYKNATEWLELLVSLLEIKQHICILSKRKTNKLIIKNNQTIYLWIVCLKKRYSSALCDINQKFCYSFAIMTFSAVCVVYM